MLRRDSRAGIGLGQVIRDGSSLELLCSGSFEKDRKGLALKLEAGRTLPLESTACAKSLGWGKAP